MRKRKSEAEWSALISDYEQMGGNIETFCRRNSISRASFSNWRKRLRSQDSSTCKFVEVLPAEPERNHVEMSQARILLPEGLTIEIEQG